MPNEWIRIISSVKIHRVILVARAVVGAAEVEIIAIGRVMLTELLRL